MSMKRNRRPVIIDSMQGRREISCDDHHDQLISSEYDAYATTHSPLLPHMDAVTFRYRSVRLSHPMIRRDRRE